MRLRALPQPSLHLRREDRMALGRIRPDHEMTSVFMTDVNACVPADSPSVCFKP